MNGNPGQGKTRIIAITNHKGGVGKTTTVVNLGAALSQAGKKVLLIDMDPQAHLSYSLGLQAHKMDKTIYDIFTGAISFSDAIIQTKSLWLVPSSIELSGAGLEIANMEGRERLLANAAGTLDEWDFVLIDCPPSLGLLTLNALTTADELFVPIQPEFLALQGVGRLLKIVKIVRERLDHHVEITGIIATLYDRRKRLNNEVISKVTEHFGDKLFKTFIRNNVSLAEAPSYGQSIFEYMPSSNGAKDYLNLSKEVLERSEQWQRKQDWALTP